MSRPNSSDPHICRSDGGASLVARLICAGSWGAIQGAKTANTRKQATKTQPIAGSGFRLASRGSDIAVVAIAGIAEVSLANYVFLPGLSGLGPTSAVMSGSYTVRQVCVPDFRVFYGNSANDNPLRLCMVTALLGH